MYTKADFDKDRAETQFQKDLATNEALLRQEARNSTRWFQGYSGGDMTRMQREMQNRGFASEVTHGGQGLRVYCK